MPEGVDAKVLKKVAPRLKTPCATCATIEGEGRSKGESEGQGESRGENKGESKDGGGVTEKKIQQEGAAYRVTLRRLLFGYATWRDVMWMAVGSMAAIVAG